MIVCLGVRCPELPGTPGGKIYQSQSQGRILPSTVPIERHTPCCSRHHARMPLACLATLGRINHGLKSGSGRRLYLMWRPYNIVLVEHRLCQQYLQLGILVFQRFQLAGIADIHPAEHGLPADSVSAIASAADTPRSCSSNSSIICSSINLAFFIVQLLQQAVGLT
jgi:hypothetical protein